MTHSQLKSWLFDLICFIVKISDVLIVQLVPGNVWLFSGTSSTLAKTEILIFFLVTFLFLFSVGEVLCRQVRIFGLTYAKTHSSVSLL